MLNNNHSHSLTHSVNLNEGKFYSLCFNTHSCGYQFCEKRYEFYILFKVVEASHGTSQVSRQIQVQVYVCLEYQICLFQNLPHSHRLLTPPYGGSSSFVK